MSRDTDSRFPLQASGYLGCCCDGTWVGVKSTPLSFSTTIEHRGCGPCRDECSSCASAETETVIFNSVTSASLSKAGCDSSRLVLSTVGDRRLLTHLWPEANRVPYEIAATAFEMVKMGWAASRKTNIASPDRVLVKESSRLLDSTLEGNFSNFTSNAPRPEQFALSASSTAMLHSAGLVETTETGGGCCCACCCSDETRRAIWSTDINFARVSNRVLQLGVRGGDIIEISAAKRHSKRTADAIMLLSLQKTYAENPKAVFDTGVTCCSPRAVLSVGTDVTRIEEDQGCCVSSMTVMRSSDVPWIYTRKSSIQCFRGILSLLFFLLILFIFALSTFYDPYCDFYRRYLLLLRLSVDSLSNRRNYYEYDAVCSPDIYIGTFFYLLVLYYVLLLFTGFPSFHAIGSICCRFTSIVVGTPGAAHARTPTWCPRCRRQEVPLVIVTCDNSRGIGASDFVEKAERTLYEAMLTKSFKKNNNDEGVGADKSSGKFYPITKDIEQQPPQPPQPYQSPTYQSPTYQQPQPRYTPQHSTTSSGSSSSIINSQDHRENDNNTDYGNNIEQEEQVPTESQQSTKVEKSILRTRWSNNKTSTDITDNDKITETDTMVTITPSTPSTSSSSPPLSRVVSLPPIISAETEEIVGTEAKIFQVGKPLWERD
jgi:hypothetical protein